MHPRQTGTATPTPVPNGVSVKVYVDKIADDSLIAEADGFGTHPTATPTPMTGTPTPEPTPQVLIQADMEKGDAAPISNRGDAAVDVIDGGANGTSKCAEITNRSQDWHGAMVDVTKYVQTGNDYEIKFYAKQSTGEDTQLELSCQHVDPSSGETVYPGIAKFNLPNGQWTECKATYTVPEHSGDISFLLAVRI